MLNPWNVINTWLLIFFFLVTSLIFSSFHGYLVVYAINLQCLHINAIINAMPKQ